MTNSTSAPQVSFSHVHVYVNHLEDLEVYKDNEKRLNAISHQVQSNAGVNAFVSQKRDLVKQLQAGFGFRITAARYPASSSSPRSVLVTSRNPTGVQFLITAPASSNHETEEDVPTEAYQHFDAQNMARFFQAHANRQGIAVLAFHVENVGVIRERYQLRHPNLVVGYWDYPEDEMAIFEVFAYYQRHDETNDNSLLADTGTVLRFVQKTNKTNDHPVPGLDRVDAIFDESSQAAYCDHWVSNVFSRTEFLSTLNDTLDFSPKVDFNAGVVAAGEAQIESTVTGNNSTAILSNKKEALEDQSQVYLPINNALSRVGHVHGFLEELGQGVQHVASRVEDLVAFVQRANDYRKMTGEGFTFLNIPRSYYGVLSTKLLMDDSAQGEKSDISAELAKAIYETCEQENIISEDGAVDLELSKKVIKSKLEMGLPSNQLEAFKMYKEQVLDTILRSRYSNLYSLLGDHVEEETYVGIVRNKILVDVQGDDLLYQIFTANILQENPTDEAPFLEFIQRVCSVCKDEKGCVQKIKPGCGGFGIRNFLTLFLSIELSKAMQQVAEGKKSGNIYLLNYAQSMVNCFTNQLNESNPILTTISDAMTEEGRCRMEADMAKGDGNDAEVKVWLAKMEEAAEKKKAGNLKLMECSSRYNQLMKSMREKNS